MDLPENEGYLPTVGRMELSEIVESPLRLSRHSPNRVALTKPLIYYIKIIYLLVGFLDFTLNIILKLRRLIERTTYGL